ncbi:ParB/Srx family N-terminal domain-containing protein [Rhodoplanes sp. TEM]|uniref:ParB/Srx family N-terminal domain-containing protein n=1 Tax=Rhodoplanes sp. TEM TaxID=3025489 RepID=UPI003FA77E0A
MEMRSVEELQVYARNAKTHSDEQVAELVASIKQWGWTTPVLVDEDGVLIAGHGRLAAARKLGITEVPVMTARGWTEAQKRAYRIADNKLTEKGEWDEGLLRIELGELHKEEFTLELTGFTGSELEGLMLPPDDGEGEGGPRVSTPVIQFNIVFDDTAQQEAWFGLVRRLRGKYPDEPTLGARLARYIAETESGEG